MIHIGAAAAWAGGATMLEIVFEPSMGIISKIQAGLVSRHVETKFTAMSWIALVTMSATGVAMSIIQGTFNLNTLLKPVGLTLLVSMILTIVAMVDGLLITFYFTPRLQSVKFEVSNLRPLVKILIRMNNFIGIIVVILMVVFTELLKAQA